MRNVFTLILVILAGYLGYRAYNNDLLIKQLKNEIVQLRAEAVTDTEPATLPAPSTTPPPALARDATRIPCPACGGEGKLMARRDNFRDVPYTCPVCGGAGYRDIVITAGHRTCRDCSGMGKIAIPKRRVTGQRRAAGGNQRVSATRCGRCSGTGLVRTLN